MHNKIIRAGATYVGLGVLLAACSKPAPTEEPVRAVKVITVSVDNFKSGAEFAGEVRARIESQLGFRVAGKIIQRNVEAGQRVKAGQALASLDAQDYRLAAEAARSAVAAAATNRNLAAADLKRYKELLEKNFIAGAEVERRQAALDAAQSQLEQAQSQLAAQRNQAGYTNLVADVSGVITAVSGEPGQVVAAGTPVFRIAQDGPRDVVFSVPEDKLAAIKDGSSVDVRVWAGKDTIKGTVREVAASADPVTRTFQIKVALDIKDPPALGTTVTVYPSAFSRSGTQVIKLPTSAFKQDGKTSAVWVVDPATLTVKSQPVQIATADGNDVVVSGGLAPGMMVVSAGVHVLQPGQKVSIFKEKASASVQSAPVAIPTAPTTAAAPSRPASAAQ
jgi:RND family efflux transporter MFP subunit